jgi:hypothetical protein
MLNAIDLHEYLIDVKGISKTMALLLEVSGVFRPELVAPESDGFVADFYTAFMK